MLLKFSFEEAVSAGAVFSFKSVGCQHEVTITKQKYAFLKENVVQKIILQEEFCFNNLPAQKSCIPWFFAIAMLFFFIFLFFKEACMETLPVLASCSPVKNNSSWS